MTIINNYPVKNQTGDTVSAITDVETALGDIETAVNNVESATNDVETAVSSVETAVNDVETAVGNVETAVSAVGTAVGNVETAIDDLGTLQKTVIGQPDTPVVVSVSDPSAATANALTAGTTYMFQSDIDCYIQFAASPTATSADIPIFSGIPYWFTPVGAYKVAALRAGTDNGSLWISEMLIA